MNFKEAIFHICLFVSAIIATLSFMLLITKIIVALMDIARGTPWWVVIGAFIGSIILLAVTESLDPREEDIDEK